MQVHFGARQEIATESDIRSVQCIVFNDWVRPLIPPPTAHHHRVSTLCNEWEAVLLHGLRKPKPKPSLRISPPVRSGGQQSSLWPLARLALSPEETRRFLQLKHTTSEIGRGRAWLRAAINERTLENYLHTILASDLRLASSISSLYCHVTSG